MVPYISLMNLPGIGTKTASCAIILGKTHELLSCPIHPGKRLPECCTRHKISSLCALPSVPIHTHRSFYRKNELVISNHQIDCHFICGLGGGGEECFLTLNAHYRDHDVTTHNFLVLLTPRLFGPCVQSGALLYN